MLNFVVLVVFVSQCYMRPMVGNTILLLLYCVLYSRNQGRRQDFEGGEYARHPFWTPPFV